MNPRHQELVDGYCSGTLSEGEFAELEAALRENPALRRRLLLRRMQWSIKDNLPAWAVRPLQKAWHRARQGSGALAAVGHDGTGELLFDDVYEAARHLSGRHAG